MSFIGWRADADATGARRCIAHLVRPTVVVCIAFAFDAVTDVGVRELPPIIDAGVATRARVVSAAEHEE